MTYTGSKKPMDIAELKAIINLCSEAGVSELQFGDVKISMGQKPQKPDERAFIANSEPVTTEQLKEKEKALLNEELNTREEQLARMILEDPAEAERLFLEGELSDESRSDDELF